MNNQITSQNEKGVINKNYILIKDKQNVGIIDLY